MIYEVTLSQTDSYLRERIRKTNRVDPFYVEILKKFKELKLFQQEKEYKVDNKISMVQGEIVCLRMRRHLVEHPHGISLDALLRESKISKDDIHR